MKQPRRLTLNNLEQITDTEITLLKRQKSYAIAAFGQLKGKVNNIYISYNSNFAIVHASFSTFCSFALVHLAPETKGNCK